MNCPCEPSKCNGFFFFFFFSPAFNEGEDSYHEEVAYQITVIACVEPARGAARGARGLLPPGTGLHGPHGCLDVTEQGGSRAESLDP